MHVLNELLQFCDFCLLLGCLRSCLLELLVALLLLLGLLLFFLLLPSSRGGCVGGQGTRVANVGICMGAGLC